VGVYRLFKQAGKGDGVYRESAAPGWTAALKTQAAGFVWQTLRFITWP